MQHPFDHEILKNNMKTPKNSSGRRLYDSPKTSSKNQKNDSKSVKKTPFKLKESGKLTPKRVITIKSSDRFSKETKLKLEPENLTEIGKIGFKRTIERTKSTKTISINEGKEPQKINKPKNLKKATETEFRLNKYISNAGICSRREADNYIKSGNVTVNGKIITEMGYKVQLTDVVKFDGVSLNPEKKRYVLLNKPKGFITSMDDEKGRKIVTDLVKTACKERIYPVGRLDRNTTGLLLFTNDGELAKKLTHPAGNVSKLYHVTLDKNLKISDFNKIAEGFRMDDFDVIVDDISYIEGAPKNEIGVKIHSGRNRIIRRIFEHFDYDVIKLDRVVFAGLTKKNLARGIWRHLTEQEVINLKMM